MVGTAPFPCRTTDYLFLTQCEGWISQNAVYFNHVWLAILYHFLQTGIHRVRALCCILRLTFLMEETAGTYLKQNNEHLNPGQPAEETGSGGILRAGPSQWVP